MKKETQRQLLVEMMQADEELGLYDCVKQEYGTCYCEDECKEGCNLFSIN